MTMLAEHVDGVIGVAAPAGGDCLEVSDEDP